MSLSFSPFLENEAVSEGRGSETSFPKCLDAERISHWHVFSLSSYPEPQTEWVELSTTPTICYSQDSSLMFWGWVSFVGNFGRKERTKKEEKVEQPSAVT